MTTIVTTTFIHCRECGHTWTDLTKRETPTTAPDAYEVKQVSLDRCTQHIPKP